jgi:hypothetical protein
MTTSRTGSMRGAKALLAALTFAGGLAVVSAEAAPAFAPLDAAPHSAVTPVQYWGDHGGWGHHRHHDGPRYDDYGHGRHHGWRHRRHHGWDHDRGWGRHHRGHHHHHSHHHHRGHGYYEY